MSQATDMRDLYFAAETDILQHGKSTRLGDQMMTTEDLSEIRKGRQEWERRVVAEGAAGSGGSSLYSLGRIR